MLSRRYVSFGEHIAYFVTLIFLILRIPLTHPGYITDVSSSIFSLKLLRLQNLPLAENFLTSSFGFSVTPFYFPFSSIAFFFAGIYAYAVTYLLFIYGIYYILAYLLSRIFYKTLNMTRISLQGFSFLYITIMFFNAVFFYDSPGIMDWVFGIPLIMYSMIKIYRLLKGLDSSKLDYVKAVLPPLMLSFADPRFTIWFLMIIIFLLIPTIYKKADFRKIIILLGYFLLIGLPVFIFIFIISTIGAFNTAYVSPRPLTLSGISGFSGAYPLFMYFAFHGEYWPSIWVSPTAYLSGKINSLIAFGSPTGLILGSGLLTYAWLSLSFIPFILSFIPIIFRDRHILYLYPGYIIFFLISIGGYAPLWFVSLYLVLGKIPIIGGIFGIAFAIPTYFMQVSIVYALLLCTVIFAHLLSNRQSIKTPVRYTNKYLNLKRVIFNKKLVVVIIILAFVLPNYQLLDGSKYPSNWTPVIGGNGAPAIGTVTSVCPPSYWVKEYNVIENQENGDFYVGYSPANGYAYKWYDSVTGVNPPGIPAPSGFYQNLSNIMLLNETYLTKTLMTMFGVKFFIVDNTTIISNKQYETFFSESQGLRLYYEHPPDLWVYEDANASIFSPVDPLVYSGSNTLFYTDLLSELSNESPALLSSGSAFIPTLSINGGSLNKSVIAVTGENISIAHQVKSFRGYSNFQWNASGGPSFYIGGRWIIASYYSDNLLSLNESGSSITVDNISGKSAPSLTVQLNGRESMIKVPSIALSTTVSGHIDIKNASISVFYVNGYNSTYGDVFSKDTKIGNSGNFSIEVPDGISYINIGFDITFHSNVTLSGMVVFYKFINKTSSYEKYVSSVLASTNEIKSPNLTNDYYFPAGATNYNLGENWTGTSFTTGALVNETRSLLNLTTVNSNGKLNGGFLVLSYKGIDLPGASLVPIPHYESTSVLARITIEYRFLGNNFTSMNVGVGATNYSVSFNLPNSSVWKNISESFLIPPGSSQFNIQIGATLNGSILIKKLTGSYQFLSEICSTSSFSKQIFMNKGNYTISAYGSGTGSINFGGKSLYINSVSEELYTESLTIPLDGEINISTNGSLALSGILIRPESLTVLNGALSDFFIDDYTGSGMINVTGTEFIAFPYRVDINEARLVGVESTGFYVYALSKYGSVRFHFPDYFLFNLSTTLMIIAMYSLLIFIYIPQSRKVFRVL